MILFAVAVALQGQPSREDVAFCAEMRAGAAQEVVPRRIDPITEAIATTVSCPTRTVTFNKRVSVNFSPVPEAWLAKEREDWSRHICSPEGRGAMARRGWRFREHWTFPDGSELEIEASCEGR